MKYIFILYCLFIILFIIIMYRNRKTFKIRISIIETNYELYEYLPSYNDMLYSFKPLTKAYWVDYAIKQRLK